MCNIHIYKYTSLYLEYFKNWYWVGKVNNNFILLIFKKCNFKILCEKINSPIQIFDLYRRYRNNRYNWAGCRLRDSGFISRFLKAGEQINVLADEHEKSAGSPWKRSRLRLADSRPIAICDFGARVRFSGTIEKMRARVSATKYNISRGILLSICIRLHHTVTPFIWANQTVFVHLVTSRRYSSTKIKKEIIERAFFSSLWRSVR